MMMMNVDGEHFIRFRGKSCVFKFIRLSVNVALYNLLYNTSLEYNSYTTFAVFFRLHTYVPSEIQSRTGFHLASSILLLLYLAAM